MAAKGIFEKTINPQKCIFVGPAWFIAKEWIEGYSLPTLFITKTADPVAPAAKLKELLKKYHVQNYQFVELPGDDHKYDDLEKIKSLTIDFLKQ